MGVGVPGVEGVTSVPPTESGSGDAEDGVDDDEDELTVHLTASTGDVEVLSHVIPDGLEAHGMSMFSIH